jgi:hypothetical protein
MLLEHRYKVESFRSTFGLADDHVLQYVNSGLGGGIFILLNSLTGDMLDASKRNISSRTKRNFLYEKNSTVEPLDRRFARFTMDMMPQKASAKLL